MKRIAIAIVVLPVSFAILWVALAFIAFYIGAIGSSVADAFQVTTADLTQNPGNLPQTARIGWEGLMQQYGKNPQAIAQLITVDSQHFGSFTEPALFPWITIVAVLGALVFALSRVSDALNRSLHSLRKLLTGMIAWPYLFAVIFTVLVLLVFALGDFLSGFSAGYNQQGTVAFRSLAQAKSDAQKPVSEAVLNFDTQEGPAIVAGALVVALVLSIYLAFRLVSSECLPWCKYVVPPRSASGYRIPGS